MNRDFWQALDALVSSGRVVIDRPKGSRHPRHGFEYPFDYGYLAGTFSPDGEGIDIWAVDGQRVTGIVVTVDLEKRDSEMKILLGCSPAEAEVIAALHNRERQKGQLILRDMDEL